MISSISNRDALSLLQIPSIFCSDQPTASDCRSIYQCGVVFFLGALIAFLTFAYLSIFFSSSHFFILGLHICRIIFVAQDGVRVLLDRAGWLVGCVWFPCAVSVSSFIVLIVILSMEICYLDGFSDRFCAVVQLVDIAFDLSPYLYLHCR